MADDILIRISAQESASAVFQRISRELDQLNNKTKQTSESAKRGSAAIGGLSLGIGTLTSAVGAYLSLGTVKALLAEADAWTRLRNQLAVVSQNVAQTVDLQKRLYKASQDTRSSVESTVQLYARLARSTEKLHLTEGQLITVTKAINQGFVVSGATAVEASNAIIQLGQGLASGTLRGDELRSVMENASYLAKRIAEGMGYSYEEFRKLAAEGKLTTEALVAGTLKAAKEIAKDFGATTMTMEQGFAKVGNAWGMMVDAMNQKLGTTSAVARTLSDIADALDRIRTGQTIYEQAEEQLQGSPDKASTGAERVAYLERLVRNIETKVGAQAAGDRPLLSLTPKELRAQIARMEAEASQALSQATDLDRIQASMSDEDRYLFPIPGARKIEKTAADIGAVLGPLPAAGLPGLISEYFTGVGTNKEVWDLIWGKTEGPGDKGLAIKEQIQQLREAAKYLEQIEAIKSQAVVQGPETTIVGDPDKFKRQEEAALRLADAFEAVLAKIKELGNPAIYSQYKDLPVSEVNLKKLTAVSKELEKSLEERRRVTMQIHQAATMAMNLYGQRNTGLRDPQLGMGGRGAGLRGGALGQPEWMGLELQPLSTNLDAVRAERERFLWFLDEANIGVQDTTDPKPVEEFEFTWKRLADNIRKYYLSPGGVFKSMGEAVEQFQESLGNLNEIMARATLAGLETFRSGISEAVGDLLFGSDERDAIKDALKFLENADTQPLNSLVEVLQQLALTKIGEDTVLGDRTAEWLRGFVESAMSIQDLPESVRDRFRTILADLDRFMAMPTEEGKAALIERVQAMVDSLSQGSGLLDRMKRFGEDLVDAFKNGFEAFVTTGVSDVLTGVIVAFGEGLIEGLTGASDQTLQDWGRRVGEGIKSLAAGWVSGIVAAFYEIGDFLAGVTIELGKAIEVTVSVLWDWGTDLVKSAWDFMVSGTTQVAKWVYVGLQKSTYWMTDVGTDGLDKVWEAFKATASTVTKTVNVALMKAGEWIGTAANAVYGAFTFVGGTATKTINLALVKAGEWVGAAASAVETALMMASSLVTKTITVGVYGAAQGTLDLLGKLLNLAASSVISVTVGLYGAAQGTIDFLAGLASPVTKLVSLAWGTITIVGDALWNKVTSWATPLTRALELVWGSIKVVSDLLWSKVESWATPVAKGLGLVWGALTAVGDLLWSKVEGWATPVAKGLGLVWGTLTAVGDILWSKVEGWATPVSKALGVVWGTLTALSDLLWAKIEGWATPVSKALGVAWGALTAVGDLLWGKIEGWATPVAKKLGLAWDSLEILLSDTWHTIETWTEPVTKVINATIVMGGNLISDLTKIVSVVLVKGSSFLVDGVTRAWEWFSGAGTITGKIVAALQKGGSFVVNGALDAWNWITGTGFNAVATILSTLAKGGSFALTGISNAWDWLSNSSLRVVANVAATLAKGASFALSGVADAWIWLQNTAISAAAWATVNIAKGAGFVLTGIGNAWDWLTNAGATAYAWVKVGLMQLGGIVWGAITDVWAWLTNDALAPISRGVSIVLSKGVDLFGGIGGTFWNWLQGLWTPERDVTVSFDPAAGTQDVYDWLSGSVTPAVSATLDWDSILGTDPDNVDPFWPLGEKFKETIDKSASAGMITGMLGAAALAFAQGGSVFEAVSTGMAAAIGAAWGGSLPKVGAGAGAAIGAAIIPLIGGIVSNIAQRGDAAHLQNLQTTLAQRGGLLGAIQYAGLSYNASTGGFDMANAELRNAMKLADRTQAIDYLSQTLRTSLQIGSTPGNILSRLLYWNDPANAGNVTGTDMTALELEIRSLTQADIADLRSALVQLGMATETTVDSLMSSMGLVVAAGRIVPPSDAESGANIDDTPLAAAALIVNAIDAAKASICYALNGSAPRYAEGTFRVPGAPSTPVPAVLHGGEMVLPYRMAEAVRAGGGRGESVTVVNNFHISAASDEGIIRVFESEILPRQDRAWRDWLAKRSKYGQIEIHNKVIRKSIR